MESKIGWGNDRPKIKSENLCLTKAKSSENTNGKDICFHIIETDKKGARRARKKTNELH